MILLRLLMLMCPRAFRQDYGAEVLRTAEDQWRDVRPELSGWGRGRFWVRQWTSAIRVCVGLWMGREVRGDSRTVGRRGGGFERVVRDLKHAGRALRKQPGFFAVAVATLGLGVGASTAMFSAVHSVLLRELPYERSDEIVVLRQLDIRDGSIEEGVSAANLRDLKSQSRTLVDAAFADGLHGLRLVEDGRAVSLRSWVVSDGFFSATGSSASLGRTFRPEEFVAGGEHVVLLSHRAWQSRFAADAGVIGRDLVLDGARHTVVGVMPPDFRYPSDSDTWTPRPPQSWDDDSRARAGMQAVARLAPGVRITDAQSELDRIATELSAAYPVANANLGFRVTPLEEHLFGDVKSPLLLLLGAVVLVLLVASANVAGLQLARGAARSREYVLRGALGASTRRITGLVAAEGLILAAVGGLLGVAIAYGGMGLIRWLGPDHLPRIDQLAVDGTVLIFALAAALSSALVAGIVPAVRAGRTDPNAALSDQTRGTTGGRRAGRIRDQLVVAEIAVALVLTIGAGLLLQSFDRLLDTELGFDPKGRLAFQVWAYDDDHRGNFEFFEQSVDKIRNVPGVAAVGLTTYLPLADDESILAVDRSTAFAIDGRSIDDRGAETMAPLVGIDPAYPQAVGVARLAGRVFSPADRSDAPLVAMVNDAFVRRHFGGRTPIGERLRLDRGLSEPREIVGVLADVRRQGFDSEPRPEIYVPLAQEPSNGLTFVAKTTVDPASLIPAIQEATWSVDPGQAIWAIRPMTDLLSDWIRQRRFNAAILTTFAGIALTLAGIGVYGLMSFSVAQRTNELGIRRALGGQSGRLVRGVLRRAVTLGLWGVGLGLVGAVALTRLLRGMLFGIDSLDFITYIVLALLVVLVAILAAALPARRATRVDPMIALRRV